VDRPSGAGILPASGARVPRAVSAGDPAGAPPGLYAAAWGGPRSVPI